MFKENPTNRTFHEGNQKKPFEVILIQQSCLSSKLLTPLLFLHQVASCRKSATLLMHFFATNWQICKANTVRPRKKNGGCHRWWGSSRELNWDAFDKVFVEAFFLFNHVVKQASLHTIWKLSLHLCTLQGTSMPHPGQRQSQHPEVKSPKRRQRKKSHQAIPWVESRKTLP